MYPISLDMRGRRVLVVGGGPVAARRVSGLLAAGAQIHVVSPYVVEDIRELASAGRVQWLAREYADGDLRGAWLVHSCADSRDVNAAVAAAADAAGVWCVRADNATASAARSNRRFNSSRSRLAPSCAGRAPASRRRRIN